MAAPMVMLRTHAASVAASIVAASISLPYSNDSGRMHDVWN